MAEGEVGVSVEKRDRREGECLQVVGGILRVHLEDGVGVRLRAALLEHLVEIVDGAGLVIGLPVHDLVSGGEQDSALVIEGQVGAECLFQRVERLPTCGGVHILFDSWITIVQSLYLVVYQDIPFRMGCHSLVNHRNGKFRFPISYHPDATLV